MSVAQAEVTVRRRSGQLPIFAAGAADPSPADLSGLLIGPGQVVRMGGTARVSVVVDAPWRVHALAAELGLRGLGMQWEPSSVEGHFGVRTAYAGVLAPLSAIWLKGAVKAPPGGFLLDGVRLRLWFTAAGQASPDSSELLLRLGANDEACWKPAVRALAILGFPAEVTMITRRERAVPRQRTEALVEALEAGETVIDGTDPDDREGRISDGSMDEIVDEHIDEPMDELIDQPRDEPVAETVLEGEPEAVASVLPPAEPVRGPALRISGRRRIRRFAELIGEPLPAVPPDAWPA
ncbi:hypothetical protein [Hamadaea tsunoensis]|uniref:hypothetical protein n=1 Tax=Hamadaea tsunoensis TaxID=53368 RepID=UPI00040B2279|nr:hypothetical protein [Hamadaea tsunoensis]